MHFLKPSIAAVAAVSLMTGCAGPMVEDDEAARLQAELESAQAEASKLRGDVSAKNATISSLESKLASGSGDAEMLPPGAKPGECYARVFTPPQYRSVSKQVLQHDAKKIVRVSQPTYGWGEERVLVRAASTKLEVIPARYDWVEERVLVREASERLEVVPAVYEDHSERILVREAYKTWKKGRGPIEKVDHMTGEIMCLVEMPAEYRTVTTRKEVKPASTRRIPIPAEYKMVKKRVMVEGPKTVEREIPAQYKTVKVRKQVSPGKETVHEVPATYQTVTDQVLVSEGKLDWRPILCETNTTPEVVRRMQSALSRAGYSVGPIDGVFGSQTRRALTRYQRDKGLASGQPTIETLRKLGVLHAT